MDYGSPDVLDHATVRSVGAHVAGLVEKPKAFPFLHHGSQIFGRVNQLLCSPRWVRRIDRYGAANQRKRGQRQQQTHQDSASHLFSLRERFSLRNRFRRMGFRNLDHRRRSHRVGPLRRRLGSSGPAVIRRSKSRALP